MKITKMYSFEFDEDPIEVAIFFLGIYRAILMQHRKVPIICEEGFPGTMCQQGILAIGPALSIPVFCEGSTVGYTLTYHQSCRVSSKTLSSATSDGLVM